MASVDGEGRAGEPALPRAGSLVAAPDGAMDDDRARTVPAPRGGSWPIDHLGGALGADNDEVHVDWLGCEPARIERLRRDGVI